MPFDGKSNGMTEPEIIVMLGLMRTWAAWVESEGGGSIGQCASIESRYVAPRPDEEQAARSARSPLDVLDAENVETALSAMRSPSDRQFLIHRHLYSGSAFDGPRLKAEKATRNLCERFGLKEYEFDRHHIRCLGELKRNLGAVERIRSDKGIRVIYSEVFRALWMRPKVA